MAELDTDIFDPGEYIKSRKLTVKTPKPGEPPPAKAQPDPPSAPEPTLPPGWSPPQQSQRSMDLERGFKQGLGDVVVDVNKVAPYVPGLSGLRDLARQVPAARETYGEIRKFTEQPSQSWVQDVGRFGGNVAPMAVAPEGLAARGLAGLAARATGRLSPAAAGTAVRAARGVGKAIDPGLTGAAAGAISNPEHPTEAAVEGFAAGLLGKGAGALLTSRAAEAIASHAMAGAGAGAIAHFMMGMSVPASVAWGIAIPGIRWTRTPSGGFIHRAGAYVFDAAGTVVGHINPAIWGRGIAKADPQGELGATMIEGAKAVPGYVRDLESNK